jgi:hypothetical protein
MRLFGHVLVGWLLEATKYVIFFVVLWKIEGAFFFQMFSTGDVVAWVLILFAVCLLGDCQEHFAKTIA